VVDSIEGAVGIYLASFVIAVISGFFPLVNAEIYLVGLTMASRVPWPSAIVLGILIACGQMVSHSLLFHGARRVAKPGATRREEGRIARMRVRVASWGNKRFVLLVSSAVLGLPPFFLTCLAAGALDISYKTFFSVGLAGRVVRFTGIAAIAVIAS
jgi:membrane protein YqaA with SNARE-associated domain